MPTLHAQTLRRARDILGGAPLLAQRLEVSQERLEFWMRGEIPVPLDVFSVAVDILIENDLASGVGNPRKGPRAPK